MAKFLFKKDEFFEMRTTFLVYYVSYNVEVLKMKLNSASQQLRPVSLCGCCGLFLNSRDYVTVVWRLYSWRAPVFFFYRFNFPFFRPRNTFRLYLLCDCFFLFLNLHLAVCQTLLSRFHLNWDLLSITCWCLDGSIKVPRSFFIFVFLLLLFRHTRKSIRRLFTSLLLTALWIKRDISIGYFVQVLAKK